MKIKETNISTIKNHLKNLVVTLIVMLLVFTIAFYKGSFFTNVKLALHYFLSFVLPGYLFVSLLLRELKSYEKIILGSITWMGVSGILAYYLNWFGLSTKVFAWAFPLISITILALLTLFLNSEDK